MERWKAIPGYSGFYEASDLGRIRSYWLKGRGSPSLSMNPRILAQHIAFNGYMRVDFDGRARLVHRLVMLAFVGPADLRVNHKNKNRTDNRLVNLEYVQR